MEQLIVHFANYYLRAWRAYKQNEPCCDAWRQVFLACDQQNLVVLQHLILGINTHNNLYLAKAAEETSPGDAIYDLQNDFEKIKRHYRRPGTRCTNPPGENLVAVEIINRHQQQPL